MDHLLPTRGARKRVGLRTSGVEMSSPRVLASLLALSVAGVVIASCGEQPSPTVASPVSPPTSVIRAGQTPTLVDMLADPTEPTFSTLAVDPYAPGTAYEPWPPGPPPKAQPGVPVPTDPTSSPKMHIVIDPEPVTDRKSTRLNS